MGTITMTNPIIKIVNATTGQEVEREMTEEELLEHEETLAFQKAFVEAENQKQALRESANSKLAALGLSPEEIAAITGA